jgi:uncharacterized protein YndB with AHSA1/START domain
VLNSESGELRLKLSATLDAPPSVVFRACTEPDELAKWWGPAGFISPSVELDLRPGGRYRIAMQPPDGELFHLSGEFREVDPPTVLSYSFVWEEPDPDDQPTIVTLSFRDLGESTELTVDQGPFATEARRALHKAGWGDSLARLREACGRSD